LKLICSFRYCCIHLCCITNFYIITSILQWVTVFQFSRNIFQDYDWISRYCTVGWWPVRSMDPWDDSAINCCCLFSHPFYFCLVSDFFLMWRSSLYLSCESSYSLTSRIIVGILIHGSAIRMVLMSHGWGGRSHRCWVQGRGE